MLDGADVLVVAFVAPVLTEEWQVGDAAFGLVFSSGLAGMTLGALFLAPFADTYERKKVINLASVIIGLGMVLCQSVRKRGPGSACNSGPWPEFVRKGMLIRKAEASDAQAIAAIIVPVIREGATYSLDSDLSENDALDYWMGPEKETFVTDDDGNIIGTYYIRTNQGGGGRHVCNCGYMTRLRIH